VICSHDRARTADSTFKLYANQAGTIRKIDDSTMEFTTPVPNPVMHESLANIYIMSKAWAEKNNSAAPGFPRQGGDLRLAQRHGQRAIPAGHLRARREDGVQEESRTGGASRKASSRATSTRSSTGPSPTRRRAWRR
jgi:hypothetical protein